jgi:microcystin-dependent protein
MNFPFSASCAAPEPYRPDAMQTAPVRRSALSAPRSRTFRRSRRAAHLAALAGLLLGAGLAVTTAPRALAQAATPNPPTKLTYQGFLTDASGVPIGNTAPVNRTIAFRLFDASSGGNRLWSSQQTVTVDKGHFSVLLGEGSAVGSEQPTGPDLTSYFYGPGSSERYLELQVDGGVPIAPRLQFLPSPYAFHARRADEVDAAGLISGVIPSARLSGVDGSGLTSLNAANLASGTLADARLSANVPKLNTAQTFTAVNSFAEKVEIKGDKVLQLGSDVAGREASAGSIGYNSLNTSGATLDIYGAGGTAATRKIRLVADGGVQVTGAVNATAVSGFGTIPVGGIIMWSGTAIPTGWALCNGQTVNGQATPDLRERFIMGANPDKATAKVGTTGGTNQISLSVANLPPHTHTYTDNYFAERSNDWKGGGNASPGNGTGNNTSSKSSTDAAGGLNGAAQPFNNLPPFYALAFIMRVQ